MDSIARGGGRIQRLRRLQALTDADLFILGGGELLKQYGSSDVSVLTWLGPLELAHEMGVPTMTYAVGVSDRLSPRAEAVATEVLSKTDALLVRDQQSLDVLRRLGVPRASLTADPALLFPELHPEDRRRPNPNEFKVSVFVNQWFVSRSVVEDEEQWKRFEKILAGCIDGLIETQKARVRFIPMLVGDPDEDDRAVAREIAGLARIRDSIEVMEGEVSPEELLALMSESSLVIGMRLHSLILATALGVPTVAIEYQSKVRRFCLSVGAPDWVVGIADPNSELIQSLCTKAARGEYPVAQVREKILALQDLARENGRAAATLISRPKSRSNRFARAARGSFEVARRVLGRKEWKQVHESVVQAIAGERDRGRDMAHGRGYTHQRGTALE